MRASSFFTRNPQMKIQCLLGPTEQVVFGETYVFVADEYGRCVATIHDGRHASVFTCHEHYIEVPDVPLDLPEMSFPTGLTAEELAAEEAERAEAEAANIEAARVAADEAQARAVAEAAEVKATAEAAARAAALKASEDAYAASNLPADYVPTPEEVQASINEAANPLTGAPAPTEAVPSTSDNLDTAETDSAEAVTLPTPKTRRAGPRKAAAK